MQGLREEANHVECWKQGKCGPVPRGMGATWGHTSVGGNGSLKGWL